MAAHTDAPTTGLLNLEKELICFICTEVLYQPLTLIDCLHTFCGACLKEWFSHQYRKATHSRNPLPANAYTCPTCRAAVKDAQHNAMINTLLDMFLAANPTKNRSEEEKAEMARTYKHGDQILPKIDTSRRRDRRRRDEEEAAALERRMVDEARERSLRDVVPPSGRAAERLAPSSATQASRSRERDARRDQRREQERRERREVVEAAENALRAGNTHQRRDTSETVSASPPPTSPRHPDAVEARQRARPMAHQASLRSLVSASESSTGTGDSLSEAQLMQEILAEGLLDGINVDELTEAEQDELSEVIAERYRQLHPHRAGRIRPSTETVPAEPVAEPAVAMQNLQIEEADRHPRQASGNRPRRHDTSPQPTSNVFDRSPNGRPTSSSSATQRPHLEHTLTPPSHDRAHNRRPSDQSGRQEGRSSNRSARPGLPLNPATRSATDLSDNPVSTDAAATGRVRQVTSAQRAQTEPRSAPRASENWNQAVANESQIQPSSSPQIEPSSGASQPILPTTTTVLESSDPIPTFPTFVPANPQGEVNQSTTTSVQTRFEEPFVSCSRCSRNNIQYEVYKHCSACDVDLCMRCYRSGRGCSHWFGFGHSAIIKFEASQPQSRMSQSMELPHTPVSRQYVKPPTDTIIQSSPNPSAKRPVVVTSSDPNSRLQEGHFCDRCGSFANACYWTCDICNDGEWGFCNDCVNTQHCCVHPLLPIAHKLFAPDSASSRPQGYDPHTGSITLTPGDFHASTTGPSPVHSNASSATSVTDNTRGPQPDYIHLTITTHCDICTKPIPPSQARFHCPSHPSPSSTNPDGIGDYDVCSTCYQNLVKQNKVKREDGPNGWRKCLQGHRMVVIAFEPDQDGGNRRVIRHDLVGGNKITEDDITGWTTAMSTSQQSGTANPPPSQTSPPTSNNALARTGTWSWREDHTSTRRATRTRSHLTSIPQSSTNTNTTKFPPDGGFGKRCLALWSYYPEEGEEGKGELLFPKNAEIKEIEEINEDWSHGVYAGDSGVFPGVYVREIAR